MVARFELVAQAAVIRAQAPDLGPEVTAQTTARYINAFERLTCRTFVPGAYPVEPRLIEALGKLGVL